MPTSTPGSRTAFEKGFSFFELLLVLLLMSLILSLVMPSLSRGIKSLEMETASRDFITRMKKARSQAIAKQKVFRILLLQEEGEDVPDSYIFADEFEQEIKKVFLPEGVSVETEEQEFPVRISFYANGRSSGALFTLRRETGRPMRIRVDPITGFPRVLKENADS